MGSEYDYSTKDYVNVNDINRVRDLIRSKYPGFIDFSSHEKNDAYFSPLEIQKLPEIEGISFETISTEGYLPINEEPWDSFKLVMEEGSDTIGNIGLLQVRCGFEEKTSKQTKRDYDIAIVKIENGKKYFTYRANGSNVLDDIGYRKDFIIRLIDEIDLPINLVVEDEHFSLSHTSSGEIDILRGAMDKDPSAFSCQIMKATPGELIDKLRLFMSKFASDKRFEYSWSATCSGFDEHETSEKIYDLLLSSNFPAEKYSLDIEFCLDEIAGVELLKSLCGPEDEIYIRLCSFELPENAYGEITIVTTNKGHRLNLKLSDDRDYQALKNELGLDFVEI